VFVTIEGGEGVGKSTLIAGIYDYLTKQKKLFVVKTFEPGATPLGKEIRNLLLHKKEMTISKRSELLLFLADRAHHVEVLIRPALNEDLIVLCDRFNDSSIAYQGGARDLQDIEELCLFATGGLVPDLTFYLDLDPKIALARIARGKDRLEDERLEFHQKVREGYLNLARKHKDRIVVLNAAGEPSVVLEEAIKHLRQRCAKLR